MLNRKIGLLVSLILVGSLLFTGCSSNSPINSSTDSSTPDSESYTLTVITEGEGSVIEEEIITTADYEKGSEVKLTAVTEETNWLFSHWEGDHNGNENPIEVIMDKNKTITAVFQATVLVGSEPYEITNWYQLDDVRNWLSESHILKEDLNEQSLGYSDLIGVPSRDNSCWNPIGDDLKGYAGNFDGNNKVISDLYINRGDEDYIGLFGKSIGIIENLEIEIVNLTGNNRVGGLVGVNEGDIINIDVSGTIVGNEEVGGLVGFNNEGTIADSYATGDISGIRVIGGLIGNNLGGTINDNCATGEVSGSNNLGGLVGINSGHIFKSYAQADVTGNTTTTSDDINVGGLVGYNNGEVEDCYAIGRIYGYSNVGGLIGLMDNRTFANINKSYSAGEVIANGEFGGLIGYNEDTNHNNIAYSYWDTEVSGIDHSKGGDGKTTSEMSQESTFVGWDFTDNWDIEEGETYPYLKWQVDNITNIPTG